MLPLFPAKSSVICSNLHAALADPHKPEKSLFLKHLSEGRLMTRQSPSEFRSSHLRLRSWSNRSEERKSIPGSDSPCPSTKGRPPSRFRWTL